MDLPFLHAYLDSIGLPNFRKGCNFAAAGSTIRPATPTSVSPFSFGVQVAQFLRFKARVLELLPEGKKLSKYLPEKDSFEKGLYMFDIGQNDLAGAFYSKSLDQILASIPAILVEFETGIQKLYDQGARNFWIHNTGPLGCLPQNVAKFGTDPSQLDELGCVSQHNQASKLFNLQLHALCRKLQGQFSDANVTYVDIFTIKYNLIANYSRYGFEQPIMACCGYGGPPLNYDSRVSCGQTKILNGTSVTAKGCPDSTEYVSWDGIHYTEAANQYVSSQILTGKYSDPPFSDKMPFLLNLKFYKNIKSRYLEGTENFLFVTKTLSKEANTMEAKIGKFFDSVGSFFSGGDQIPWCDRDIIVGCEREVAEVGDSDERKSDSIMRLSWALVHSRQPEDVQRGIAMLEASLVNNTSSPLQQREKLYLLAIGYYRSGAYSRSRQLVEQCLEIAPDWRQALTLKKAIEDKIAKDGVIGIGITATAVGLIAGGIAAALARKK